jgi:hypothetical protein
LVASAKACNIPSKVEIIEMPTFPENAPRFIRVQIERAGTITEEFLHTQAERYFAVRERLGRTNKDDWKARSGYWGPLLSLIPFVIEWWAQRDHIRRDLPVDNFTEIKEMTIEFAVRGLKGQMENVKELVAWYPDLQPWKDILDKSTRIMETSEMIHKELQRTQSISKKELQKVIVGVDKRLVSDTLKYLEKFEMIIISKTETDWMIMRRDMA